MTREELHTAAMALPGAALDVKWGDDHCYCVGGKMFCATDGAYSSLSFKATDIAFEALTESGRAKPSKYLARAKWVILEDLAAADAAEVSDWVRTAYGLVVGKLPKARRRELGLLT
jgi:predicted DNA-binding protein (MmcQ/YjbR family)